MCAAGKWTRGMEEEKKKKKLRGFIPQVNYSDHAGRGRYQ
jgi:hypothetical protein